MVNHVNWLLCSLTMVLANSRRHEACKTYRFGRREGHVIPPVNDPFDSARCGGGEVPPGMRWLQHWSDAARGILASFMTLTLACLVGAGRK
jgi:hypothetical protein